MAVMETHRDRAIAREREREREKNLTAKYETDKREYNVFGQDQDML